MRREVSSLYGDCALALLVRGKSDKMRSDKPIGIVGIDNHLLAIASPAGFDPAAQEDIAGAPPTG